jgi:hypothetical protein
MKKLNSWLTKIQVLLFTSLLFVVLFAQNAYADISGFGAGGKGGSGLGFGGTMILIMVLIFGFVVGIIALISYLILKQIKKKNDNL